VTVRELSALHWQRSELSYNYYCLHCANKIINNAAGVAQIVYDD
jgi:hypothetical protein